MALTNFLLTVAVVGAGYFLVRGDVKQSATIFRRNIRHIQKWLEEPAASASKAAEAAKPKELPKKDIPKED